jgi:hypothetical protein
MCVGYFIFICLKDSRTTTTKKKQADKHTRKETTKITKENSTGKHKWKRAECDHVKKGQKKRSEAESFRHMKIKYLTHLKMAM